MDIGQHRTSFGVIDSTYTVTECVVGYAGRVIGTVVLAVFTIGIHTELQ